MCTETTVKTTRRGEITVKKDCNSPSCPDSAASKKK